MDFKKKIQNIGSIVATNYHHNETGIVSKIVNEWNRNKIINLPPFFLNGSPYNLWLEFSQAFTHGKPYITTKSRFGIGENDFLEYETEFGDFAIVVEYIIDGYLLCRKVSVLQTKKESKQDETKIPLHQLYFMWFWPSVSFNTHNFTFKGANPEEFSFYHFILDKSNLQQYSSSICSSPFIGVKLGLTESSLINQLKNWLAQRKTSGKKPSPSPTLKEITPGAVEGSSLGKRFSYGLVPKPFGRFLQEAAYLFVGTENPEVLQLANLRIPNLLVLRVRAGREEARRID